MSYLNVEEVEFVLRRLSEDYPQYCRLIQLPNKTHENRKCHALSIFNHSTAFPSNFFDWLNEWLSGWFNWKPAKPKKTILIVGGHHAREWVPPDALVYLCQRVIHSLHYGSNIVLGNYTMTKSEVVKVLKGVELVIFPQVNPDGRNKSMTTSADVLWRKNLRPNPEPAQIGVDLNRNYNYLWDYPQHFSSTASVASSTDPAVELYIGPSPFSEPETKNVNWLVHEIKADFFIDVHSYSEFILYNWADDESQDSDPNMNFMNQSYDGERGIKQDALYREYIRKADSNINRFLATKMADAIKTVRNHQYTVQEWVDMYAASGTSTDFFQSLHYRNSRAKKIRSFCIESGNEFQPAREERAWVIKEITAALLEFSKTVALQPI